MTYNLSWRLHQGGRIGPQVFDCKHISEVLATSFFETLGPTRCVICDEPGSVLCVNCAAQLPEIDLALACPRCGAPFGKRLCTECPMPGSEEALRNPEGSLPFAGMRAALSYESGAKDLIRTYKDGDELRLDMVIASLICRAIRGRSSCGRIREGDPFHSADEQRADWSRLADIIVTVPATREALRKRGFDHMNRVGRLCSAWTGLPLVDALTCTRRTADQRELNREMRIQNRSGSFSVADEHVHLPPRIILIDDVFTTGATCIAAAKALQAAGVREVYVAVCARVW